MPKVTYTPLKGLVQAQGKGFVVNDIVSLSGTKTLDATTFLTVATAASTLTLPSTADTGAVKVIIVDQDGGGANIDLQKENTIFSGGSNPAVRMNSTGEMVICIYNGTEWIVGDSKA